MLKGIKVKPLKRLADERGFFTEIMRKDWKDFFQDDTVAQANFSITYPTIIRAWHKHLKGQTDYFIAIKGAIKICAYDEKTEELNEIVYIVLLFLDLKLTIDTYQYMICSWIKKEHIHN